MDIEQAKKDFDNGVMICRGTWARVLEAAVVMEQALSNIVDEPDHAKDYASRVIERVGKL